MYTHTPKPRPSIILGATLALLLAVGPRAAFAADGSGSAPASPSSIAAGETGATLSFAYAPSENIHDGTLRLTVPSGWTAPTTTPGTAGYTTVSGAVVGTTLDTLDSASGWTDNSILISTSADGTTKWSGSASLRMQVAASLSNGNAYRDFSSGQDWSGYTAVSFWYRGTQTLGVGDLQFVVSESTGLGGTPTTYAIPGSFLTLLGNNAWGHVVIDLTGAASSTRDSIRSVGFRVNTGALSSFYFDNLVAGPALPQVSGQQVTIPLVSLASSNTATVTYGAGGGASGVTVPSSTGTATFGFAQQLSSAGTLTNLATQPTVTVVAPSAPSAPGGLSATPGNGQATLAWNAPASTGGSPVTDYLVEYREVGASTWDLHGDGVTATPGTTIMPLTNGTAYEFRVRAENALGLGSFSNVATATPAGPPGMPDGVVAERGDGTATVTFGVPASDGGAAVTSYEIETLPGGATTTATSSPWILTGLDNGTEYTFAVRARNSYGLGEATVSNAVIPAGLPGTPANATGTPDMTSVALSWDAADGNGSDIVDYEVRYRAESGLSWETWAHAPSTDASALVEELEADTAYEFSIAAINEIGTGAPSTTTVRTLELVDVVPDAPYGVVTDRGDEEIAISWTEPFDGRSPITDYVIEYRLASEEDWITFEDGTGSTASTVVTGLTPGGVSYHFRIAATNAVGTGPWSETAEDFTNL